MLNFFFTFVFQFFIDLSHLLDYNFYFSYFVVVVVVVVNSGSSSSSSSGG